MTLKEITADIEQRIAVRQAEDFDNIGLLCGNPDREITGILVSHDATEAVIDEAVAKNMNLVVCFHPIIFSGLKSITGKNYVEKAVMKAMEQKVAIYAVHTAWDNDFFGVNYGICEALGLQNQKVLIPKKQNLMQMTVYVPNDFSESVKEAAFAAGAGNIGFYDECSFALAGQGTFRPTEGAKPYLGQINIRENIGEDMLSFIFESYKKEQILRAVKSAHPYEEVAYQLYGLENENQYSGLGRYGELQQEMESTAFLQLLKERFQLKVIRHSTLPEKKIRRIAVLGGSGADGIKSAAAAGCHAYITGDLKYHDFFQAEDKMLVCDIGHYESEQFVCQQLYEILSEKFLNLAVLKSETKTNPVNYFL